MTIKTTLKKYSLITELWSLLNLLKLGFCWRSCCSELVFYSWLLLAQEERVSTDFHFSKSRPNSRLTRVKRIHISVIVHGENSSGKLSVLFSMIVSRSTRNLFLRYDVKHQILMHEMLRISTL